MEAERPRASTRVQGTGQHIQVQERRSPRTRAGKQITTYKAGWGRGIQRQSSDGVLVFYLECRARVSQKSMLYRAGAWAAESSLIAPVVAAALPLTGKNNEADFELEGPRRF